MAMRYMIGQHGAKRREQRRLTNEFVERVSGRSHESEHAIGFEPLNQTSNMKRGRTSKARKLEKEAWAYQEQKKFHRGHIGTGTTHQFDGSGFNSDTYRDAQRSLIEAGAAGAAVQINQLGYAFLPKFQNHPNTRQRRSADNSFALMARNMDKVTYAQGKGTQTIEVSDQERLEMFLSRIVAAGEGAGPGGWPSAAQIKAAKQELGINKK